MNKLDEEHYKVEKELTPFMKFHKNYEEFKVFRNNVCLERSLIARIKKLQNYRKLGLQSFAGNKMVIKWLLLKHHLFFQL